MVNTCKAPEAVNNVTLNIQETEDKKLDSLSEPPRIAVPRGQTIFELLPYELNLYAFAPAISMITFYNGLAPVEFLKNRVHAIIAANPWLAGRLVTKDDIMKVCIPTEGYVTEIDHFIDSFIEVHPTMEYWELCKACEKILVTDIAKINQCDKDATLFRVSICRSGPAGFAVLISISHAIADVATRYLMQGMLGEGGQIKELPGRINIPDDWRDKRSMVLAFGQEKADYLFSKVRLDSLKQSLASRKSEDDIKASVGFINMDWIDEIKAQYIDEAKAAGYTHLSTNDVVASWMAVSGGYTHIEISYDFRGRYNLVTRDFAGGYSACIFLCSSTEFGSPLLIRKAVATTINMKPSKDLNLSVRNALAPIHFCFSTNWCQSFNDMELPNCTPKLHLPILRLNMGGIQVIFKATKDQVGMLLVGLPCDLEKLHLSESIPYSERLCKGMEMK